MKTKKYLKIAGGVLCGLFALSCALKVLTGIGRLQQASGHQWENIMGYLFGACAGVVIWGGVSFYLFRSAKNEKDKPDA